MLYPGTTEPQLAHRLSSSAPAVPSDGTEPTILSPPSLEHPPITIEPTLVLDKETIAYVAAKEPGDLLTADKALPPVVVLEGFPSALLEINSAPRIAMPTPPSPGGEDEKVLTHSFRG